MPTRWPDVLYDYDANNIKHADIDSLDLDKGKWFKCMHCRNPKDVEGKFHCRTPFSGEQVTGSRGHIESKLHQDRKEPEIGDKPAAHKSVASLLKMASHPEPEVQSEHSAAPSGQPQPNPITICTRIWFGPSVGYIGPSSGLHIANKMFEVYRRPPHFCIATNICGIYRGPLRVVNGRVSCWRYVCSFAVAFIPNVQVRLDVSLLS